MPLRVDFDVEGWEGTKPRIEGKALVRGRCLLEDLCDVLCGDRRPDAIGGISSRRVASFHQVKPGRL